MKLNGKERDEFRKQLILASLTGICRDWEEWRYGHHMVPNAVTVADEAIATADQVLEQLDAEPALPVYVAVKLTKESRDKLLLMTPPVHHQVFAEHITLAYQPSATKMKKFKLGEPVKFMVCGHAADDQGQAVRVSGLGSLPYDNSIPHITISTKEGVKPFYSNKLLATVKETSVSFELEGVIDTEPSRAVLVTAP